MKLVRIINTVFATNVGGTSEPVFEGGKDYPVNPDTLRQVALRNGEEIDVPDDAVAAVEQAAETAPVRARKPREPKAE